MTIREMLTEAIDNVFITEQQKRGIMSGYVSPLVSLNLDEKTEQIAKIIEQILNAQEAQQTRKRKYVIADSVNGMLYFIGLETNSRTKAVSEFRAKWEAMTEKQQNDRSYYELLYTYDDGEWDAIEMAKIIDKAK